MKKDQCKVKKVDIGGQAVMEGVMMRSPDAIAIAVRRPDGSIVIDHAPYVSPAKKHKWMGLPFIRGAVSMATMLSSGMKTLETSTKMLGIGEEEPTKFELWLSKKLGKGIDKIVMGIAIVLAVILSVGLFIAIPAGIESVMKSIGMAPWAYTLIGGIVKIAILIGYMAFCSLVPDVRRTFMYHGAEHKTVYCNENNLPLTPENAQKFSCLHPRCGTAFLLIVFTISIFLFLVLNTLLPISNYFLRLGFHLLMLPIVAGVSYEALKGMAHCEAGIVKVLRWPGLQMQRLTTRQPDDDMVECAIVAMNCALHGLPENCEITPDGYTRILDYRIADPSMRSQVDEEALKARDQAGKASKEDVSDLPDDEEANG